MRLLAALALCLLPMGASALDCTPFQSVSCEGPTGYFDLYQGMPGEMLCGTDYTGWTFSVIELVITQPGYYFIAAVSGPAPFGSPPIATDIHLMDDCAAGSCQASSYQGSGANQLGVCLDAGTYTYIVASDYNGVDGSINTSVQCPTCEEVNNYGIYCVWCQVVENEDSNWGAVKGNFE